MNAWIYLLFGILFEVVGTTALKYSNGFTESLPSMICVSCFVIALYCLSLSVKELDISVVYAIWSGVGIAVISLIGVFYFQESMTFSKLFFIGLIVAGVVGLQLVSTSAKDSISQPETES
ncbi:MAG: small multidrug resistance pump [Pseudoalteromonas tetraodonis]|jgi:small multidrug resistance pump